LSVRKRSVRFDSLVYAETLSRDSGACMVDQAPSAERGRPTPNANGCVRNWMFGVRSHLANRLTPLSRADGQRWQWKR
jgi:hypothetical protein